MCCARRLPRHDVFLAVRDLAGFAAALFFFVVFFFVAGFDFAFTFA